MRRGVVVAFGGCLVALAACGGGSDAEPIVSSSATAAEVTTTPADSTSTTSTTTTTTTTEPPATTVDPTEALIADIEADLNEGEQALFAAGADPDNPDLRADLETYFSGKSLEKVTRFLDQLVNDGLLMRPSHDVPNVIVVEAIVEGAAQDSSVTIALCRVDAAVVYTYLGEREGIFNDDVLRSRANSRVRSVSGVWRLDGGDPIDETSGATTCD